MIQLTELEQRNYTIERTIDELYLCLMTVKDDFYDKQAYALMHIIPIYKPTPVFEIKISDINDRVIKELDDRWKYKKEIDYILQGAVGKIFKNIDERYFLLSVKQFLKVGLIE